MKRILVVEDEPSIADLCQRVLTAEGFEVDTAVNGLVAQTALLKKKYHLCLIDIRTPLMNGTELYHHIEEKYPGLVNGVIFTSGDTSDGYTKNFFDVAGRPSLPKPFTPDELKTIVRETLGKIASSVSGGA